MRRILRIPLQSLPWLIPTIALAWPRLDLTFMLALVLPISGAILLSVVADPISVELRDGEDAESEHRVSYALFALFLLAGLDHGRLLAAGPIAPKLQATGAVVLAIAYLLRAAALHANPFFAGRLVIQSDRGHGVIHRGPYAWVRHPGNLSAILILAALPFALGTMLCVPAALAGIAVVLHRTIKEDRFLVERLPGYDEYALKVRARLLPGIY